MMQVTGDLLKTFIIDAATHLNIGPDRAHIALVQFSNRAQLIFKLDECTDSACVDRIIRDPTRLRYLGGTTNIADGLRTARTQVLAQPGDRPNVKNLVVLITDGAANEEEAQTLPEANMLQALVDDLFVVGITDSINEPQLRIISTTGDLFYANTFSDLTSILEDVSGTLCVTPPPATGKVQWYSLLLNNRKAQLIESLKTKVKTYIM